MPLQKGSTETLSESLKLASKKPFKTHLINHVHMTLY